MERGKALPCPSSFRFLSRSLSRLLSFFLTIMLHNLVPRWWCLGYDPALAAADHRREFNRREPRPPASRRKRRNLRSPEEALIPRPYLTLRTRSLYSYRCEKWDARGRKLLPFYFTTLRLSVPRIYFQLTLIISHFQSISRLPFRERVSFL